MSFSTKPAFVHYGPWDDETRKHPAMKFMEAYTTQVIDKRKWDTPAGDWNHSEFAYVKSDGSTVKGNVQAWEEVAKTYGVFTGHLHEPFFASCTETDEGYEMIGQATLYANLQGQAADGETKVKDHNGKQWDVAVPSGFHFQYIKDAGAKNGLGFLLKKTEIMSDTGPVVLGLLRRGVLKPQDLGL